VTPLIGVGAAALILGEPLTVSLGMASALIISGLILVAWPHRHSSASASN
jgi:drug/metabolite transporter (DMT)-like permease